MLGWKEFEMEVVRDKKDNCIIICSIENIDPMGVHTGDSITIAPALTLTDKEYQILRDASIAVLREIGVETGGSNVQFAINPADGRLVVIEMNPRVSRSSALASKATGFPIAKVAAKLAVGYTLDEIANDITGGATPASFEPTIDYVVTKIPRFAFEKFPGASPVLTTSMKSVGEAMAIGRTFQESLQKALRSLETGLSGLDEVRIEGYDAAKGMEDTDNKAAIRAALGTPTPDRLLNVAQAMRLGANDELIHNACRIDPWFLAEIRGLVEMEAEIAAKGLPTTVGPFHRLKAMGFSDKRLGKLTETDADDRDGRTSQARRASSVQAHRYMCRRIRFAHGLYVFDLRNALCRKGRRRGSAVGPEKGRHSRRRSEPNRPGHRVRLLLLPRGLRAEGSRLRDHHGQLQSGDRIDGLRHVRPALFRTTHARRCARDHRHRTRNRHAARRDRAVRRPDTAETRRAVGESKVPILGTSPDAIDLAEDRDRFKKLLDKLKLRQPQNGIATSPSAARAIADEIGYPVVIRPSYVLGGRAMEIVRDGGQLDRYVARLAGDLDRPSELVVSKKSPLLIDRYLSDATEVDVDCLADGKDTFIAGIMEHIEEAGIHSGDSACALPPHSLSEKTLAELERQTRALALALNVGGLMNVQYAIKDGEIYVLEVNPRASRTVPFVAKVIGLPFAKIAARIMAGEKLKDFNLKSTRPKHRAVKEAVFPFARFPGVDTVLGPEMKSTGEVMGIDGSFEIAFAKARLAAVPACHAVEPSSSL